MITATLNTSNLLQRLENETSVRWVGYRWKPTELNINPEVIIVSKTGIQHEHATTTLRHISERKIVSEDEFISLVAAKFPKKSNMYRQVNGDK